MSITVARRTFSSNPQRDALKTWEEIVGLLTQGKTTEACDELLAVKGVAANIVAEQAPKNSPIVVTCDGPRTRIYCLYDNDAIDGSDANEDPLGFDPLNGDWHISLPCPANDLSWVRAALRKHSDRITARDVSEAAPVETGTATVKESALVLDKEGFLGS